MKKQQGVTLLGFVFFAAITVCAAIVIMRLFPIYYRNYNISYAIDAMDTLPKGFYARGPNEVVMGLREKFINQLAIEGINYIKPKDIKIKPTKEKYQMSLHYERRIKLIANIDAVVIFDHDKQVGHRAE